MTALPTTVTSAPPAARGNLRVFGSSAVGPGHVSSGLPCQDACAYEILPPALCAIAVADGLGSAAHSDLGAQTAVNAAVRTMVDQAASNPGEDLGRLLQAGVAAARAALERVAGDTACPLRDLACTLLLTILHGERAAAAHVGDGAIVAKTAKGLQLLSGPGESEYANEVIPLTSKDWARAVRVATPLDGVKGIMVFTDGLQRAALRKNRGSYTVFDGFCDPLFTYANRVAVPSDAVKDIKELLLSAKMSEHSEDDKTLVVAILQTPAESQQP